MRKESEKITIGVVGIGYWGSKHMRVLRSMPGVAAVIGIDERYSGAENGPDRDGVAHADLADALPAVDAVVIATPPSSHAALGLQAISAGKHVLIEKPLATSAAEAEALVDAAETAGVILMPGHTFEHNAAVQRLRQIIRENQLGQLYYLDCARLNLGLYQSDVNVILDLAPHDISIANFVLDSQPTLVTAWGSRHIHPELEDVAYLRLDYGDIDVRVNIHVSWLDPRKVRQVTAVGSRKMALYDDMAADERIRLYDKAAIPPGAEDGPLSKVAYRLGDVTILNIAFPEPLVVQDQHFVDSVLSGTPPVTDGDSGLRVVQVLQCAQISLAEHRPVALAEVTADCVAIPGGSPSGAASR